MNEWWLDPKLILDRAGAIAAPVVGFFAAWLTFEWTERRRRALALQALRRGVRAELRQAEVTLSSILITVSTGAKDTTRAAQGVRWFLDEGHQRLEYAGVLQFDADHQEMLTGFAALLTAEIADLLQKLRPKQQGRVVELRLPVLELALVAPTSGLRDDEIQSLCAVRWQVQLLSGQPAHQPVTINPVSTKSGAGQALDRWISRHPAAVHRSSVFRSASTPFAFTHPYRGSRDEGAAS
jgi:hypothetical protein